MPKRTRLPETRRLTEILPSGREGGLEFARIVDLLLFHEARRRGRDVMLFSDRAGDYRGLDSFDDVSLRRSGRVGYQYKFYPSPLSDNHRTEIEKSLKKARELSGSQGRDKLARWILVTPDDLTESSQRKNGGDVSWFDDLPRRLGIDFQLDHWGHRKLQALFLDTPSLCLFYYPELVPGGNTQRRTIRETRQRYDRNLRDLHGRIEFVGMSVYKPDVTRGVPMERIYIPLSVVGEQADDRSITPRTNPVELLQPPGGRHIVLGDPGSGKSTLLKFLALCGQSPPLQRRYGSPPDTRLPILMALRRYADELKRDQDLPLIDYVERNLRAELSVPHIDRTFLEYYLESGQAMLLFDGMDELPNSQFKQTVRDRIHGLLNTYPGNTAVVTSRIVGYEDPFRFDGTDYRHHKVARLTDFDQERFVANWYAARIDDVGQSKANAADLTRILRDNRHQAIGDLAANPLLLTIISLVHRIDAVLPDERVVLYQKCTETLLNTWHTWKVRAADHQKGRGRAERWNRRRIEALAHWMHIQSGGAASDQRSVVPHEQACHFLAAHILLHERPEDPEDAKDWAEDFLDFVKARAGLLLELGDGQYSFVHLSFQEYLTAMHLGARMEVGGLESLWPEMAERCLDSRWHEVLRLLVAGLRSSDSRSLVVQRLIALASAPHGALVALLLGGLFLDGIEAAEQNGGMIAERLFLWCLRTREPEHVARLISTLRDMPGKNRVEIAGLEVGFRQAWAAADPTDRRTLILAGLASGVDEATLDELTAGALRGPGYEMERSLLLGAKLDNVPLDTSARMAAFQGALAASALESPVSNRIASLAESAVLTAKQSFGLRALLAHPGIVASGPFMEFGLLPSCVVDDVGCGAASDLLERQAKLRVRVLDAIATRVRPLELPTAAPPLLDEERSGARHSDRIDRLARRLMKLDRDWGGGGRYRALSKAQPPKRYRILALPDQETLAKDPSPHSLWGALSSNTEFTNMLLTLVAEGLALEPRSIWVEALRTHLLPRLPDRLRLYQLASSTRVEARLVEDETDEDGAYSAAWMLLQDMWLYLHGAYDQPAESPFARLADLTRACSAPPLQLAHCLRDIAHGKRGRERDLCVLMDSTEPAYRQMFKDIMWDD